MTPLVILRFLLSFYRLVPKSTKDGRVLSPFGGYNLVTKSTQDGWVFSPFWLASFYRLVPKSTNAPWFFHNFID